MKRILLTLLAVLVVLGLFAATGYTGYRFGYAQGIQASANDNAPQLRPFDNLERRGMPMHNFGRGFEHGFGFGGYPMMGFFSPWIWIGRLAVLALVIWFVYWLVTRSGWHLVRETPQSSPPKTENE